MNDGAWTSQHIKLFCADCMDIMPALPPGSADMILADLPYGTTACRWDQMLPLDPLWAHYKRLIRPGGAIVLTASQPFASMLVMSNLKWFKHEWVWEKARPTGFQYAKSAPMRAHELVLVFASGTATYRPRMTRKLQPIRKRYPTVKSLSSNMTSSKQATGYWTHNFPNTIITFAQERGLHPTQKPVALAEYLIRTYSNDGDTVLDNTMGVGSFGVAAVNTGRSFIGIERDDAYFDIAEDRITHAASHERQAEFAGW